MEDLGLQLLNYGVLGLFSLLMLSALVVAYKLFRELFDEYRDELKSCKEIKVEYLKEILNKLDTLLKV
jgi:hypothetical protein